jgi:transcriptional regulator with XRE-family HTH domain
LNYRSDRSLTGHQKYFFATHSQRFDRVERNVRFTGGARHGMVCAGMNAVRRLRLQMELSQAEFATRLGVAEQTYRTWDSGRRTPPRSIVYKAKRLQETAGGLLPLQRLADEYRIHVRTLRKAAQDGRLQATFSTRMAFGKLVASPVATPSRCSSAATTAKPRSGTGRHRCPDVRSRTTTIACSSQ